MDARKIWDYLLKRIGNPYGTAGVMGNLQAESGLNPRNLQNSFEAKLGYTDDSYTEAVDSGKYGGFVFDGAGYGLAQWTYWSRKTRLLAMARERSTSIGDLDTQLDVLWAELQASTAVLRGLQSAQSVREASDIVLTKYERPADQSEAVKVARAAHGQRYYDQFAGGKDMAVKIGSARIDENGHAKGGRAGDQIGKEVSTQSWYKHSKGWRVFRAKNPGVAEKIAQDMQWACNNKNIGYDQNQRGTLYSVSKPLGFNCSMVTTPCETDCSALVRVCCAYAGVDMPNFRTTDEASVLQKSGAFVEMKGAKYQESDKYLRRGDILVTKTQGHTVVVLTNGSKAGSDDAPADDVLHRGDKGEAVKAMQEALVKAGWSFPRYGCDGDFGAETEANVKGFQRTEGLPVTGVYDAATRTALMRKIGAGRVEITGGSVNVRTGPGTNNNVIGVAKKGERYEYGLTTDGWVQIDFKGATGWVSTKYANITEG